jgi:GNAT superfamily N-acetyltransferase
LSAEKVTLRSGEHVTIRVVSPPMGAYADKVGCWAHVRDDLLAGRMSDTLDVRYFVAEIGGEVVGSMGCYTPRGTRSVGLVEFVETDERHRRKGIASLLLGRLIAGFRSEGGKALLLCTTNPIAGSLYEKHGFWYTVGDGMMYVSPDAPDFPNEYLSHTGAASVRGAEWGDLPGASLLYNNPEPDWLIKDYLTGSFRDTRFERHFTQLMRGSEEDRGAVLVLESPANSVVGVAAFHRVDSYYEQHVANLSFRACPAYYAQADELLKQALQRARGLSLDTLQVRIADVDEGQKELVRHAGFSETARLPGLLRDGDLRMDALIYTHETGSASHRRHGRGDYYGGRQHWQDVRVRSKESG